MFGSEMLVAVSVELCGIALSSIASLIVIYFTLFYHCYYSHNAMLHTIIIYYNITINVTTILHELLLLLQHYSPHQATPAL